MFSSFRPRNSAGSLLVLALAPRPALSIFDFVTFSSAQQCGPFSIQFSGGTAPANWPPQLTVVPCNSTPLSIPLYDASFNDTSATGHALTFLPLPAGTQFVASLDDGVGVSAGPVSNVITVDPSSSTSCLKNQTVTSTSTTAPFTLSENIAQCETFNVTFDTAQVVNAPSIRAFIPGKLAFPINQTSEDESTGTASYIMEAAHGSQLSLLLSGGGHKASSGLLTVAGNSKSSGTCLVAADVGGSTSVSGTTVSSITSASATASTANSWVSTSTTTTLSQGAIVAIAASAASVVVVIVAAMGIWLYCARRKLKSMRAASIEMSMESAAAPGNSDTVEKTPSLPPAVPTPVHSSWEFQMQTSWGTAHSKSSASSGGKGLSPTRGPLYTNSRVWLSPATSPNAVAGSSRAGPGFNSGAATPTPVSPSPRIADAGALRRTPPVVSAASVHSHSASGSQSRGHSRSQTQSSVYGSRFGPQSPSSPTPTMSTVDIEHILDMSERYGSGAADGREVAPPLPPPQPAFAAERDSLRLSAYYAGHFPGPSGVVRMSHTRDGSSLSSSNTSSVRGHVSPLNLHAGSRTVAPNDGFSLLSPRDDPGPVTRLMMSPTVRVNPDGVVTREPPHAHVPHSPMPSPPPSPL